MEGPQTTTSGPRRTEQIRWNRREAAMRQAMAARVQPHGSERAAAKCSSVPRSTLRRWWCRQERFNHPASTVAFMESPEGVDFLHRIDIAARLIFCEVGPCGTRLLTEFLQLTGLDDFIANSYGSQYHCGVELQEAVLEFADEETSRLASNMSPREITVCQDETFHPQTCLVAIEPLSDFILLEEYTDQLDSRTWTTRMGQAIQDLPVKIVQSSSDEGRSLIKHCRQGLGAHHSPDLFHIQKDVSRAFSGKANGAVQQARTKARRAERETTRLQHEKVEVGSTHASLFDTQIQLSQEQEAAAAKDVAAAKARRQQVRDQNRGISEDYHPFDLHSGAPRDASQVEQALEQRFDQLEGLADEFNVSGSGRKLMAKARKNIGAMVATISFFWQMFAIKMDALGLPEPLRLELADTLLPATYLEYASQRASKAEDARRLRALSETLLARARDGPLQALEGAQKEEVERVVRDCAGLFQRSSSCVEGRNGRLALHHHGLHRLSDRKLRVLTALHNYFLRRADRTTAAERFFGQPPRDLFQWLLERLPLPARPRRCSA